MSKANEVIGLIETLDFFEAIKFKTKTLLNKLATTDKDMRKFWKAQEKEYPELRLQDPNKSHAGYKANQEATVKFEKDRLAFYNKFFPLVRKEIQKIKDDADPEVAKEYNFHLRNLTKEIYDDAKRGSGLEKALKKVKDEFVKEVLEIGEIVQGKGAVDKFMKDFSGKELKGKISTVRKDRFFGQNRLLNVYFKDDASDITFPFVVDAEEYDFMNDGQKIKAKFTFNTTSPNNFDHPNVMRFEKIDNAVMVFVKSIKKG